jgi:hypothetical protein
MFMAVVHRKMQANLLGGFHLGCFCNIYANIFVIRFLFLISCNLSTCPVALINAYLIHVVADFLLKALLWSSEMFSHSAMWSFVVRITGMPSICGRCVYYVKEQGGLARER